MIYGDMRRLPSGRKKTYNAWSSKKRTQRKFEEYVPPKTYRRECVEYPSADCSGLSTHKDSSTYRQEESKKFTVAPAYNKGAYQVVSSEDVEYIGK